MPDIRTPFSYRAKMLRIERAYMKGVQGILRDGRRELLDILSSAGVKMSTIPDVLRVIRDIGAQAANQGESMSKLIDQTGLWYLEQQRKQLYMAGERDIPTVNELNSMTALDRAQVFNSTLNKEPQWVGDMARALEINMTRLSVSNADLSAASDRLLSTSITDGRASVLRLASANAQKEIGTNVWVAGLSGVNVLYRMVEQTTQTVYSKQAIAAIDERTTDCCLRVHGQIQPLDKPFILYGTPRFADKVDSPPFHWYCRTAQSLYTQRLEERGPTTQDMMDAAKTEIDAREETGTRVEIHPADSTSRRR